MTARILQQTNREHPTIRFASALAATASSVFRAKSRRCLTSTSLAAVMGLVLGWLWSAAGHADVLIYDNLAGGAGGVTGASFSDDDATLRLADDFSSISPEVVRRVEWTGAYIFDGTPPATDSFTINVHADNDGDPMTGPPLASFAVGNAVHRVDSGVDLGGFDVYQFSANINFALSAGTTYWLSVFNNTDGEADDFAWTHLSSGGNNFETPDGGATWNQVGFHRLDFRLYSIPEPSLLCLGWTVLGAAALRRRNRRQTSD